MKRGHLIVLSGPSGVGKNAVEFKLRKLIPDLQRVVTATTRPPRPKEQDGKDYFFFSKDRFKELADQNAFIEWAVVHDQMYGALKKPVETALAEGKNLLLIVDVQGALKYKEVFEDAYLIFIAPESLDQLKQHLSKRHGSDPADLQLRLENAAKELNVKDFYDAVVINKEGKLGQTAQKVAELIKARID